MSLECKNLSFSFVEDGVTKEILKNLDFSLNEKEIKIIYGPIGIGKSTLLYILSGLLENFKGKVVWDDFEFDKITQKLDDIRSKYISVNFSNFYYLQDLDVEENIVFPAIFANKSKEYIRKRLDLIYDTFSHIRIEKNNIFTLKSFSKIKVSKMSNGQKEIVMLARALMNDTPYLLADEMLRSFNTNVKKQILQLLFERMQLGIANSMMLITHDDNMVTYIKEFAHDDTNVTVYDFADKTLKERV